MMQRSARKPYFFHFFGFVVAVDRLQHMVSGK